MVFIFLAYFNKLDYINGYIKLKKKRKEKL